MRPIQIRDIRQKHFFVINDEYLNGYAKIAKPTATAIYSSLCRHADTNQSSFPSVELLAQEHGISISTAQRAIRKLVSLNIVAKERVRNPKGKWLNNTYFLLDKSVWAIKSTGQKRPMDVHRSKTLKPTGQNSTTKDTHNKDTHIIPKGITKQSFGNEDINFLITYLKEKLSLPLLDGTEQSNRRYCWLALKKFGGVDGVRLLVEATAQNSFWSTKVTSFQQLYYKGVQIISDMRGGKYGKYTTK